MKVKIQIKSIFGKVLFELEKENNTIKDTLFEAIKSKTDLSYSDLSGSDLRGSDLRGLDLSYSNLSYSDLSYSDLRGSNLSCSNLSGSNLSGSNLPVFCKWLVSVNDSGIIKIGCKEKNVENWDLFFSGSETFATPRDSEDFKRIYANYVAIREYYKIMNS